MDPLIKAIILMILICFISFIAGLVVRRDEPWKNPFVLGIGFLDSLIGLQGFFAVTNYAAGSPKTLQNATNLLITIIVAFSPLILLFLGRAIRRYFEARTITEFAANNNRQG